jgi:hypothetical protein
VLVAPTPFNQKLEEYEMIHAHRIQEAANLLIMAHDILMFESVVTDQGIKLVTNPNSAGLSDIRNALQAIKPEALKKLEGYPHANNDREHNTEGNPASL